MIPSVLESNPSNNYSYFYILFLISYKLYILPRTVPRSSNKPSIYIYQSMTCYDGRPLWLHIQSTYSVHGLLIHVCKHEISKTKGWVVESSRLNSTCLNYLLTLLHLKGSFVLFPFLWWYIHSTYSRRREGTDSLFFLPWGLLLLHTYYYTRLDCAILRHLHFTCAHSLFPSSTQPFYSSSFLFFLSLVPFYFSLFVSLPLFSRERVCVWIWLTISAISARA